MIKEEGIDGSYICVIKATCNKLITNIKWNEEKNQKFFL
jgi:hypothetical protein